MPSNKIILQQFLAANLLVHAGWALPAAPTAPQQLVVRDGLSGPVSKDSLIQAREPGYQAGQARYQNLVDAAKANLYGEKAEYKGAVHNLNVEKSEYKGAVHNLNVEKLELYGAKKTLNDQVGQLKGLEAQRTSAVKDLYGAKYQLNAAETTAKHAGEIYNDVQGELKTNQWKAQHAADPQQRYLAGQAYNKDLSAVSTWQDNLNRANKQVWLTNGKVYSEGARVNLLTGKVVGQQGNVNAANYQVGKEQQDYGKAQYFVNKERQDVLHAQGGVDKERTDVYRAQDAYNRIVADRPVPRY
ncbi:hypothetical protein P8C59_005642 [Phyllachora maydis]|uniref:Uncharacterized protein n=1 Tax=Phyllachora maydis TaxID=1825666 RepID=A0AAD9I558_9PEZI|nr:hypothetical protein P8C59_005642 [Phyllachora maydis]